MKDFIRFVFNFIFIIIPSLGFANLSELKVNRVLIYNINACDVPSGLNATNVAATTATLNCNAVNGATLYTFRYKINGGAWEIVTSNNPTKNITGLTPNSTYQFSAKATCPSGTSAYSANVSFNTLVNPCITPAGMGTSNVTINSATFSWSAVSGAISYTVQYREQNPNGTWGAWNTPANIAITTYNAIGLTQNKSYQWHVKTNCSNTSSSDYNDPSLEFTTLSTCQIPTNQVTSGITLNAATLAWSPVASASSYKIQYRVKTNSTWGAWIPLTSSTDSLILSNLTPDTDYQWQVRSVCSGGLESNWSTPITAFTTVALTCNTPSNPNTLYITQTTATLKWNPVSGVSSYKIQYKFKNAAGIYGNWIALTANTDSINLTSLVPDRDHQWQVRSVCSPSLESAWSTPVTNFSSQGCTLPTAVITTGITTTSAVLNWNPIAGVLSFKIQYRVKTNATWGAWMPLTSNTDSLILSNLAPDTDYQWQVKSVCSGGLESAWTTPITAFTTVALTCLTPSNIVTSQISTTSALLDWSPVSGVTGYKIQYREKNANGTWGNWTIITVNVDSFLFTGLNPDKDFQWQVRSVCSPTLESAWSTPIENFSTLGCTVPVNTITKSISGSSATLKWTAISGAISYKIQYREKIAGGGWGIWIAATSNVDSLILTGLVPETDYQWQVKSVCSATLESAWSTPIENFTTLNPCTAPTNLSSINVTLNSATIKWTAVQLALSYTVEYKIVGDPDWIIATTNIDTILLSGLTVDKNYVYRVKANCNNSTSPYSATPNPTFHTLTSNCITPIGLTTTFVTSTSATLFWTATDSNFLVQYRAKLSGGSWGNWMSIPTDTNYLKITGLLSNTDYQWRVKRICPPNLESDFSDEQLFTTANVCQGPIIGMITNISQTTATLNWTVVGGPIGLVLFYTDGSNSTILNLPSNQTSFVLTNLSPGTSYYYYVNAICLPQDTSNSNLSNFSTISNCSLNTPTGLNEITVGTNTAILNWIEVVGALYYKIEYRKANEPNNWLQDSSIFTTKTILALAPNTNYIWKIRSVCVANQLSPFSIDKSFKTLSACPPPDSLFVSNILLNSAVLNWEIVQGALSYQYQITTNPNSWTGAPIISNTNIATATNLILNTTYYFRVRSICANGDTGIYSIVGSFTTLAFVCSLPTGLTTTGISSTKATFNWDKLANPPTLAYLVCYKKVADTIWSCDTILNVLANDTAIGNPDTLQGFRLLGPILPTPKFTYSVSGLMSNTEYEWKVKSICINGESSDYNSPTIKFKTDSTCGMAVNLSVVRIGFDNATLKWSNTGGDIALFKIRYRKVGTSNWTTKYSNKDSVKLTGLMPNSNYEFQVQTVCSSPDTSAYSAIKVFTTLIQCNFEIPLNLIVSSVTSTTASLNWTAPSATNFELFYKKTTDINYTVIVVQNPYLLTGLIPNTSYMWKVRNKCAIGYGDTSATSTFITSCKLPDSITAISPNLGMATISWNPVNIGAISYTVRYRITNTPNWIILNVIGSSISLTGLDNATQYEYQIQTNCSANETSTWSTLATFIVQSVCTMGATGLNETYITNNSAKLNWNAVTQAEGNAFGFYFILYRKDGSDPNLPASWTTVTSPTNSLQLNGLVSATIYFWKVNILCTSGYSYSQEHSFTTLPGVSNDCSIPINLTGIGASLNSINLNWNAVANSAGYKVQYSLTNGSNWSELATNTNSITISGLQEDKLYYFRVANICSNPSAYSNWSSVSSAYTFSQCNIGTVNTIYEWNLQMNSVELSWIGIVPTAINYEIRYKFTNSSNWTWTATTVGNVKKLLVGGLWASTSYDWQIRPLCSNNVGGNWSVIKTFVTPAGFGCGDGPEGLMVTKNETLSTEATVSWSIRGEPVGHFIKTTELMQDGSLGLAKNYSVRGNENSFILSNLKSDTRGYDYNVEVAADCGQDGISKSETITFKTNANLNIIGKMLNKTDKIELFPNPTKGKINLNFDSENEAIMRTNIIDITGKIIQSEDFNIKSGKNNIYFDLNGIDNGIYYLELNNGNLKNTLKFIVFK